MVLSRYLELVPVLALMAMGAPTSCEYSCPGADENGQSLLARPYAIPLVSEYSIFECIYGVPQSSAPVRTCSYDKVTGAEALSAEGNGCPPHAHPCGEVESPLFSKQEGDKAEIPSWVEAGRYMFYVRQHPPE
ncbi:hypothetical protein BDQ17DRAFT_1291199 [Cyathus striatus]|nr:hypothetical protein BDQ17DRAFT_1291199 [Cyathus striatus]